MRSALIPLAVAGALWAFCESSRAQDIDVIEGTDLIRVVFDEEQGVDLINFIALVQRELQYQFLFSETELKPPGGTGPKITSFGTKTIKRTDLFKYFQALLRQHDFVCVRIGPMTDENTHSPGFWSIRRVAPGAKPGYLKSLARIIPAEDLHMYEDNPGLLITTSVQLKYIEGRDAATVLTPYFADQFVESIRAIDTSNTLLMTGYASTLAGIQRLIGVIDRKPDNLQPKFQKRVLKYAVADELQPILKELITASRGGQPGRPGQPQAGQSLQEPEPQIIAEPRTNSLLITASGETLTKILSWVEELDIEVDPRGDTHVYRLKNTSSEELSQALDQIIQGQVETQRPPGASGSQAGGVEQQATVVAHAETNSLVITASRTKYAELLEIIKQLDIRPAQVLIETALIEISATNADQLGVELQTVDGDSRNPFGATSFGLSSLLDQDGDGFEDTRVPNIATGFTGGIFDPEDFTFPILVTALSTTTDANVLSMPSILTNDNEQALIESTDEVPFQQNTVNNETGEASISGFGGYEDAGIRLEISPSISAGNYVRLEVQLQISTFSGSGSPPPRIRREVNTYVTIPDGHTMVIGGILVDDVRRTESKIPILGDIPLIGPLFRSTTDDLRKVNLYIFITPHIISDDFAALDDLSYRHRAEAQSLSGRVELLNRFFSDENPDARNIPSDFDALFEMPSYASPPTGDVDNGETGISNED